MADFYHYTSRVAAQMCIAAGHLLPGLDGWIYLTDSFFPTGAIAAERLGIPVIGPAMQAGPAIVLLTKAIEVVCVIPPDRVPALVQSRARRARPFLDGTGRVIYSGQGREFRYPDRIDVIGLSWVALAAP